MIIVLLFKKRISNVSFSKMVQSLLKCNHSQIFFLTKKDLIIEHKNLSNLMVTILSKFWDGNNQSMEALNGSLRTLGVKTGEKVAMLK